MKFEEFPITNKAEAKDTILITYPSNNGLARCDADWILRASDEGIGRTVQEKRLVYEDKEIEFNEDLIEQIQNGTFTGINIGNYFVVDGVSWVIVDFDYWFDINNSQIGHHIVVMPKSSTDLIEKIPYNSSDKYDLDGAQPSFAFFKSRAYHYMNTDLYSYLDEKFDGHIVKHDEYVNEYQVKAYNQENVIDDYGDNQYDPENMFNGYLNETGLVVESDDHYVTDFLRINPGSSYEFTFLETEEPNFSICMYDENQVFMERVTTDQFSYKYDLPDNCLYIRVSSNLNCIDSIIRHDYIVDVDRAVNPSDSKWIESFVSLGSDSMVYKEDTGMVDYWSTRNRSTNELHRLPLDHEDHSLFKGVAIVGKEFSSEPDVNKSFNEEMKIRYSYYNDGLQTEEDNGFEVFQDNTSSNFMKNVRPIFAVG